MSLNAKQKAGNGSLRRSLPSEMLRNQKLSDFCVSPHSSEVLTPFVNFAVLPSYLQTLFSDSNPEGQGNITVTSSDSESGSLEVMRQVGLDQEIIVEKWLWTRFQITGAHEDFQKYVLYKKARGSLDLAFEEFFWNQHGIHKTSSLSLSSEDFQRTDFESEENDGDRDFKAKEEFLNL